MSFRRLPDQPVDPEESRAWGYGASMHEWHEWERTGVFTVSMRVKWWWRRTWRMLR